MSIEIPAALVLVDVHGVVADFTDGAASLFDVDADYSKARYDFWRDWPDPVDDRKFWGRIEEEGADFWAGLDCMSTGFRLVQELRDADVQWAFCTAAVGHKGSYDGTVEFCRRWFGDCRVIGTEMKHELAGPNRLLIDDYEPNVVDFIAAGGTGYLWPQPWNVRAVMETAMNVARKKAIAEAMG